MASTRDYLNSIIQTANELQNECTDAELESRAEDIREAENSLDTALFNIKDDREHPIT